MSRMKQSSIAKHYSWVVTPEAYFATALLLCEQIPVSSFIDALSFSESLFTRLGFLSPHPNYELIYPIVFNFKHGIELHLKGFACVTNQVYRTKHDFQQLFDDVINNARTTQSQQVMRQLKADTWPIIAKYYYGTYCPNIKTRNKPDMMNEAERYPENDATYNLPDPYEWVTKSYLQQIKSDIEFVAKSFHEALWAMEEDLITV